ncbi:MAG TPA: hypothetical protein PLX24_04705 [Bacteroidales bacterium]|nr:MAG: hypothetical protein BWX51_00608 [Bacteroidetes bacterium ADurb.Bin012]HNU21608.1 hypothetical protein [Bacteroidales bacterium]HNV17154.1 hypothetical protein [Bacteroidales bacterium]HNZ79177.1 hypothetical protein [Bacteroidales bacterium]HOX79663.1 hypothetical protein [Bacteroidales bacterium]
MSNTHQFIDKLFSSLMFVLLLAACSSTQQTATQRSQINYSPGVESSPKGVLSESEKQVLDDFIARKIELIRKQQALVPGADTGNEDDSKQLAELQRQMQQLDNEINAYLIRGERRDYYYDALQKAMKDFR